MLKTSIVCSEGPYLVQLSCFNEHTRVKLYGHKIYCNLKVYESQYKHRAKNIYQKTIYFKLRKIPIEKFIFQAKNLQFFKNWTLLLVLLYYSYDTWVPAKCNFSCLLTLSWRRPLSYRNQAGFYMITASVMKESSKFLQ